MKAFWHWWLACWDVVSYPKVPRYQQKNVAIFWGDRSWRPDAPTRCAVLRSLVSQHIFQKDGMQGGVAFWKILFHAKSRMLNLYVSISQDSRVITSKEHFALLFSVHLKDMRQIFVKKIFPKMLGGGKSCWKHHRVILQSGPRAPTSCKWGPLTLIIRPFRAAPELHLYRSARGPSCSELWFFSHHKDRSKAPNQH